MPQPNLSIFTGTQNIGRVINEQSQLVVKFWEGNIPLTGSVGRVAFNFGGKSRTIVVQGVHDGTGFTGATVEDRIDEFIFTVESWVNNAGAQENEQYTDSLGNIYDVDCLDFTWRRSIDNPSRILFSMIFKES